MMLTLPVGPLQPLSLSPTACTACRTPTACRVAAASPQAIAGLCTPQARPLASFTPPSGPQLQKHLQEELAVALMQGSLAGVQIALARGHHCRRPGHYIHEAVLRRNPIALELLLAHEDRDGLEEMCSGQRPLVSAITACTLEGDVGYVMMELLLRYGANPNCRRGEHGHSSPLHYAASANRTVAAELLIAWGADPNEADSTGMTPLHYASRHALEPHEGMLLSQREVISALLRANADPTRTDNKGNLPRAEARGPVIVAFFWRAERWWSRRALKLVSRSSCNPRTPEGASQSMLPEAMELIEQFL